jgi:hypothetical protein
MNTLNIHEDNARLLAGWLQSGRGVAHWESIDLSDPGYALTTPALTEGKPTPKPHWKVANEPVFITFDPANILVQRIKLVKRFHIAVRTGANGLMLKVSDGGSRRIRREVTKAGEGAFHVFDYETQDALIYRPIASIPLPEWLKGQS